MLYYLFKLKFLSPVHFGADTPGLGLEKSALGCHADTVFSAFCHEALAVNGKEGLMQVVNDATKGKLVLSDALPYIKEEFYIPRPVLPVNRSETRKPIAFAAQANQHSLKKRLKKLDYIPVSKIESYIKFIRDGGDDLPFESPYFGVSSLMPKVAVSGFEEPQPYNVGLFTFTKDAGLYIILGFDEQEQLPFYQKLLESLSYSGLGGKRTSGYGRFELAEDEIELDTECSITESDYELARRLRIESSLYMTLSVILPAEKDWNYIQTSQSAYTLVQRRGFIYSKTYSDRFLKHRPAVMFNAGSCFPGRLQGMIADVSQHGSHPVYRYGKGLMIGVIE